jgi:predicted nucleic acid-binding protein
VSLRTGRIAGEIDAKARSRGVTIPTADLLIGATALELGFAVATANVRHFRLIPRLRVRRIN